jgi:peptidyl-prolyl cis-trans isomerase SurA
MFKIKIFIGALILQIFIPLIIKSQTGIVDEVIAVVGDSPILRSDVESQYQQIMMQGSNFPGDLKCHIFEQLLVQKMLLEQAKIDSIEVSENTVIMWVDRQINEFINRAGSKEKLEEWLNKPLYQIKQDQREMVRNQLITQQMQEKITGDIKVTPSEIRQYYRTNSDSLPMVPVQFEVQQISIYPRVTIEETEAVKTRLRDFQRQINEGRDFATLAVLYSEDPGSAARGGEMGYMARAELVSEFAQVAFNLQDKNRVSKIVETEFGFHIIQLIDRQGDRINVRHILLRPKPSYEAIKEAQNKADSIAGLIREGTMTFEEAALRFSMDKDSRANGGLMVNQYNQSTKFDVQHIAPSIYREIEKMQPGEISKAFMMKDERLGKDYYTIIKLKSFNTPHKANLKDDYQLIEMLLEDDKREDTFKKWIIKKQQETYISISPNWVNCEFEFKGWVK